jgi:serine/threonine protein kinase
MGIVYEAQQETPKRRVALKLLRPTLLSEKARRRFAFETEVLARLQHSGIAQIFEAGTVDTGAGPQPYFAMERIEGSLLTRFAEEQQLGTRERVEIFVRICEAVQHAHQKGVIHRDLKPANILVDGSGQPKILDFGIARATDSDLQTTTQQTDVSKLIGTIAYMSPEQAAGSPEDVDTRSDVYTLGVILYELLVGCLPYDVGGKLIHEAVRIIRENEPTPLSSVQKIFRGDLEIIVGKALEKKPELRFPSANDMAEDIERYLRQEPITARPPSALYRMRKFTTRNKTLVAGLIGILLSLSIGLLTTISFLLPSKEHARQSQRNASRATANEQRALQAVQEATREASRRAAWRSRREAARKERYRTDPEREARRETANELRLSDAKRLRDLEAQAEKLWPVHPDMIEPLELWLDDAQEIIANREAHHASLAALRSRSLTPEEGTSPAEMVFERAEDEWWYETLYGLVEDLRALADLYNRRGVVASVQGRLQRSRTIEQRSLGDYQEEWDEAINEIALGDRYDGLEMEPQIGLVPIGPDPESRLWEFWHVESGERPERDEQAGALKITGECGIVLVLIPGGTFAMGYQSQNPDPDHYDGAEYEFETPVHEVTL